MSFFTFFPFETGLSVYGSLVLTHDSQPSECGSPESCTSSRCPAPWRGLKGEAGTQHVGLPTPMLTLSAITRTVSSLMILDGLSVRDTLSEEAGGPR